MWYRKTDVDFLSQWIWSEITLNFFNNRAEIYAQVQKTFFGGILELLILCSQICWGYVSN